jgi:hypothetical protein
MAVRVLQHNCQRSVDAMTTLMAKAAEMAELVLIQEPALRWVADVRGGNSRQQDTGGERNRGSFVGGGSDGDHGRGGEGVAWEGVAPEMDTGKEREVVEDGRSGFEIIISSGYAQMDRQESGHSLGLQEGSVGEIMGD